MDFTYTDDQRALQELAEKILSDACDDEALREFAESDAPYDADLWAQLAESGLLGMAVSEENGGLGLGIIDFGLLLNEQGRTLAPIPLTAAIVLGAMTLDRHGSDEQRERWLGPVLAGETLITAALEEVGTYDATRPATTAKADGNGWRIDGIKSAVPYGPQAEALIVSAWTDSGPALFLIPKDTDGVTVEAQQSTDGEPQALVTFNDVALDGDALIGALEDGGDILADTIARGRIALSQRQAGLTGEALRRTAEYSSGRIQFGKPLGSMQAVQQRAADAFIDVEAIKSASLLAAWQYDSGDWQAADVQSAKYWAAMGGHRVVHTAQHLHGGMGADVTYPIHRYFLTATAIAESLGGANPMLAAIGEEIATGKAKGLT